VSQRVLGVDPGTAVTGYGVLEHANGDASRLIECGVIRTNPRQALWTRLQQIHEGLAQIIERLEPQTLAIESLFYAKNVKTTISLGHARGAILVAAAQAGLDVAEFPPATVKKTIVGSGGANKTQVAFMVQQLLRLRTAPEPDDAADGVAIALTYLLTKR